MWIFVFSWRRKLIVIGIKVMKFTFKMYWLVLNVGIIMSKCELMKGHGIEWDFEWDFEGLNGWLIVTDGWIYRI